MERQQEKIYMDALNFGDYFFNSKDLWDLNFLKRKVQDFLNALKRMKKYYLEIFLDGNNISLQCDEDYKKRVEERMIKQENKWPNGCNVLLSDAFKQHGIKVHWSLEADCDDTIATFAFYDKASILSRDKDFLCYFVDFKIYSEFKIDKNEILSNLIGQQGERRIISLIGN